MVSGTTWARTRAQFTEEAFARIEEVRAALPECVITCPQRHHWLIALPDGRQIQYWPGGRKWAWQHQEVIKGDLDDLIEFVRGAIHDDKQG